MNNFDLYRKATLLADSESAYQLAKRVVELEERLNRALLCIEDREAWVKAKEAFPNNPNKPNKPDKTGD